MEQTGYWQQFISTGKVEDYLRYAQNNAGVLRIAGGENAGNPGNPGKTGTGVFRDAGVHLADRDGIKTDAGRRI